ncbi:MAG: SDR family oxidoreductase, partial [Chloroflexota bacterium]
AVIHLAALVGDPLCHREPQRAVEVNYLATKYLARACGKAKVRLIFASTCSVYGVKNEMCREEGTDPEPFSVYGLTKLKAETDVLDAGGIAFRMATIYGVSPRMRFDLVINEFIREAKTEKRIRIFGGSQIRPFLEIGSAARTYIDCLKSDQSGEIFNLSDGSITLLELGKNIGEIFGCRVDVIPELVDKRSYAIDPSKAINMLGFKPKPIMDGIEEMKSLPL